jgi:glycosyltransferase involved in cell wall biosynthesis
MTKYAAGIASAMEPVSAVECVSATHLNMPPPFRWAFPRYRHVKRMPRRWPEQLDLVHFTDVFVAPHAGRFPGCPRVSTLHDMIPMEHARTWPVSPLRWRLAFLRSLRSLKRSDAIVTPSENTKREYLAQVDEDPARVHVVPVVVPDYVQPPPPGVLREQRTILIVGTTAPYKNVPVLLHALSDKALGDVRVIRVGGPFRGEYARLADKLGVAGRFEFRQDISEEELIRLYQKATVLAQPSLTEGFGMPVAEAMAAGLPVVSSDGGSLPEVGGAAARIVPFRQHHPGPPDLDDARDFGRALAEVLDDGAARARMSEAGIAESTRFRATAVREALLTAYASAQDALERRG